jgi:hypothetical protein
MACPSCLTACVDCHLDGVELTSFGATVLPLARISENLVRPIVTCDKLLESDVTPSSGPGPGPGRLKAAVVFLV